jgi:ferredoxin
MADPNDRYSKNVPGPWYVDNTCIACGLCENIAPSIFRYSADDGQNYVHHQPKTLAELALARDAMESCPVDAIGNDGEK